VVAREAGVRARPKMATTPFTFASHRFFKRFIKMKPGIDRQSASRLVGLEVSELHTARNPAGWLGQPRPSGALQQRGRGRCGDKNALPGFQAA
jgi:hypothetical protein